MSEVEVERRTKPAFRGEAGLQRAARLRDATLQATSNSLQNARADSNAGGLIAVVIANIAAIILVRMLGKNLTEKY